jgi:hypothetical protein
VRSGQSRLATYFLALRALRVVLPVNCKRLHLSNIIIILLITINGKKLELNNRQCYQIRGNAVDLLESENQGVIPSHLVVWETDGSKHTASKTLM